MSMSEKVENDEEAIRAEAYKLWLSEGQPHGRAAENWAEAKEIVALRQGGFATTLKPLGETVAEPVEPEFVAENEGDVPGPFVDTGEAVPAPSRAAERANADAEPLSVEDAEKTRKRGTAKRR
jgi:hypothetical protein